MRCFYLRTTAAHAHALVRYGFGDPHETALYASPPPGNEIFNTLIEIHITRTKAVREHVPGIWLVPASALHGAVIKVLEEPAPGPLTYVDAELIAGRCGSYDRMAVGICLHSLLPRDDWLKLIGNNWSVCDNIWRHLDELRQLLRTAGPLLPMMTPEEIVEYHALPSTIVVYRGASELNKNGMCWSLERDVAARFPFLNRYRTTSPTLYSAKVRKMNVLAVKLDRTEQEVITFGAEIFRAESIQ